MTPTQVKSFKDEVSKVYTLFKKLSDYFNTPLTQTVCVLLQNLSFDGSDCDNYNHQEEVKKIQEILSLLNDIQEYDDWYLVKFAFEEVSLAYSAVCLSED